MTGLPVNRELETFRARARQWLADNAPRAGRGATAGRGDPSTWQQARQFQAAQYRAGFSGITWPERYGGQGLTGAHQAVFNQEAEPYDLPSNPFQITLAILGQTLLDHGTEDQKRTHLPRMLNGDALWVQLLSEPSAGSDLAGVRTRADRDGDEWILNGEKVWSSYAQWSDYATVLARTDWDVPKHGGLTMFIMPLHAEGVTIRPLKQISGDDEFCQEFLDNVRLPESAVLGSVNRGWSVTVSMSNHSRQMTAGAASTGPVFDKLRGGDPDPGRELIHELNENGLASNPDVRRLVAELVVDNVVSGLLAARVAQRSARPGGNPALSTMAKLFGAVTLQRRYEIELQLRGEEAVMWKPGEGLGEDLVHDYLWGRTATIAGGTHEVNNNTIGERVLGLPGEPTVDRDRPFREVLRSARA